MFKRYFTSQKTNGMAPYVWVILCILPFYFIGEASSTPTMMIGIVVTLLFFLFYRLAYVAKGWSVYIWTYALIAITTTWTIMFNYVYLAFFLAYHIGNVKKKVTFFVLYFSLLVTMAIVVNYKLVEQSPLFMKQIPFVVITLLGVILLPFNIRNRNEVGQLESKLEDANRKISELVKIEERERIARDLHDTLGQRLSLIGLKSDLARRLIEENPEQAQAELVDVQQTARTALNEVRKLVSSMRTVRLHEELIRVQQLLKAAEIEAELPDELALDGVSLLTENILSMCLKEAVNNVVKHSEATRCTVTIEQTWQGITIRVADNGTFKAKASDGHGLRGMRERLEFANGQLDIVTEEGTTLVIYVPNDVAQKDKR